MKWTFKHDDFVARCTIDRVKIYKDEELVSVMSRQKFEWIQEEVADGFQNHNFSFICNEAMLHKKK